MIDAILNDLIHNTALPGFIAVALVLGLIIGACALFTWFKHGRAGFRR